LKALRTGLKARHLLLSIPCASYTPALLFCRVETYLDKLPEALCLGAGNAAFAAYEVVQNA
jgi:hypothetical protein